MKSTLILPTYNGLHRLKLTLPFILCQTKTPSQIIIVVDGSSDGTVAWLNSLDLPKNVYIYLQPNAGRAAARNAGARLAKSEILVFVDDDIRLPFDFIERHLELQAQYPDSIVSSAVLQDLHDLDNLEFCKFRRFLDMQWNRNVCADKIYTGFHLTTACMSISRAVFYSLHCFDERLTDGEDFLLGMHAVSSSVPIHYDPTLVSYHCDYPGIRDFIRRNLEHIRSKQQIMMLYPDLVADHSNAFSLPSASGFLKQLVRRFFAINAFWDTFLNSKLFMLLPPILRYKTYDLIVSSSVYTICRKA